MTGARAMVDEVQHGTDSQTAGRRIRGCIPGCVASMTFGFRETLFRKLHCAEGLGKSEPRRWMPGLELILYLLVEPMLSFSS
jgi:hypothetical protein